MGTKYATERRTAVTVNIESHEKWDPDGVLGNLGRWDARTGGTGSSEETKIRPAGGPEEAIGGVQTAENVTCWRYFKTDRDAAIIAAIYNARGKADASASEDVLDRHEDPTGTQLTWPGVLMDVDIGDADSTSTDDKKITIVISASAGITVTP